MHAPERPPCGRVPFFAPVTIRPLAGGRPAEAGACELGLTAARLCCAASPPVGQAVRLAFRVYEPSRRRVAVEEVPGRVAEARADEVGAVLLVRFLAPLDPRVAPALLARLESS